MLPGVVGFDKGFTTRYNFLAENSMNLLKNPLLGRVLLGNLRIGRVCFLSNIFLICAVVQLLRKGTLSFV